MQDRNFAARWWRLFLTKPGGDVSALSTGSNASSEGFGGALLYADNFFASVPSFNSLACLGLPHSSKISATVTTDFTVRIAQNLTKEQHMPEQRGKQATADVKSEWTRAYQIYLKAPGDRYDKKKDRTARIDSVANELSLTRKQAKRRVRNYEAWQRNIKKGLVEP